MRKFLSVLFACVMMLGCLCVNAGAIEMPAEDSESFEVMESMVTRASGSFNMSIAPRGRTAADSAFPLSAGETVRIRATYDPENASVDFGLIDSAGEFHYVNVKTGSIDQSIEVPDSGDYTLAIRNNSAYTVKVSGFVRY